MAFIKVQKELVAGDHLLRCSRAVNLFAISQFSVEVIHKNPVGSKCVSQVRSLARFEYHSLAGEEQLSLFASLSPPHRLGASNFIWEIFVSSRNGNILLGRERLQ